MPQPPEQLRVVSLLPSATEMVCAVGMQDSLVGVSHECDFPPGVVGRPILTSSKVLTNARSGEIDRDVRRVLREALAVYDIDTEALQRTAPDVIVTQDLCDVCAVSLADVEKAAKELLPEAEIVNLHPTQLADVWSDIRRVGSALGREAEAEAFVRHAGERIAEIRRRASALASRPTVLTIEWIDPVMVGGTWMPELVELAGGEALVTKAGDHAPTLSTEELRGLAPEVVLLKPCGFELERTMAEMDTVRALLADMGWPAVRDGRVFAADGNAFFNRPGPRLVESLEILAACVHPGEFGDFGERHVGEFVCLEFGEG